MKNTLTVGLLIIVIFFHAFFESDVNAQTVESGNLLLEAAQTGDQMTVRTQLEKDGFTEYVRSDGQTPLILATRNGHVDIALSLIDAGANVNHQAGPGWTALILASEQGQNDVVTALLEKGVDVELQTNLGETALMVASRRGHTDIVNYLMFAGADRDHKRRDGQTAENLAAQGGYPETVKALAIGKGSSEIATSSVSSLAVRETVFAANYDIQLTADGAAQQINMRSLVRNGNTIPVSFQNYRVDLKISAVNDEKYEIELSLYERTDDAHFAQSDSTYFLVNPTAVILGGSFASPVKFTTKEAGVELDIAIAVSEYSVSN